MKMNFAFMFIISNHYGRFRLYLITLRTGSFVAIYFCNVKNMNCANINVYYEQSMMEEIVLVRYTVRIM